MGRTFSENWHRVANVRACLRASVSVRRQYYRGEDWYVVHDPFTGDFFRLTPAYYDFLTRLDFKRTIEEVWLDALENDPEHGPGQEDVISLLMDLSKAGLIRFHGETDTKKLFEQGDEKESKARRQKWMNILFIRFKLFNPDRILTALSPLWNVLISWFGAAIWVGVFCCGLVTALRNVGEISFAASSVLAPGNLIPLYAGLVLLKLFHETGHAAMCKRFGGHVTTVGVMFLFFAPLPYVDATSSWSMDSKWQRILVSSAGILAELFIGAICCMVWAWSPPGLVHTITFNMMLTATVSTLLFNANPLMRFDGYYILSDLLEIPNLNQRSREHAARLCEKYFFSVRDIRFKNRSSGEGVWLALYGVASSVYRVVLVVGISMFLADNYFIIGLLAGAAMAATTIIKPIFNYFKYLLKSPSLRGVRVSALVKTAVVLGGASVFIFTVPLPYDIVTTGVVESRNETNVIAASAGRVVQLKARSGEQVRMGQVLLVQENPTIDFELRKAEAQLHRISILGRQALSRMGLDRDPVEKRRQALAQLISQLHSEKQDLTVTAGCSGIWGLPDARSLKGQWVPKGQDLGRIGSADGYRFSAVVPQEDASTLFDREIRSMTVRLKGVEHTDFKVAGWNLQPHYHVELPSAALGWRGGGDIPLSPHDDTGRAAAEPFYLLEIELADMNGLIVPEGRTGTVRIDMAPVSLANRLLLHLRQFLQKRYRL